MSRCCTTDQLRDLMKKSRQITTKDKCLGVHELDALDPKGIHVLSQVMYHERGGRGDTVRVTAILKRAGTMEPWMRLLDIHPTQWLGLVETEKLITAIDTGTIPVDQE